MAQQQTEHAGAPVAHAQQARAPSRPAVMKLAPLGSQRTRTQYLVCARTACSTSPEAASSSATLPSMDAASRRPRPGLQRTPLTGWAG